MGRKATGKMPVVRASHRRQGKREGLRLSGMQIAIKHRCLWRQGEQPQKVKAAVPDEDDS